MRAVGRRLVVAGTITGLVLVVLLVVAAPFALAQTDPGTTDTTPQDTTPVKHPPITDPPPPPPVTSPPATSPPATAPRQTFVPFVPAGGSAKTTTPKTTPTTRARSNSNQPAIAPGAAATQAPATTPVANPATTPLTDPVVQVAGKEVTRKSQAEKLIDSKGLSNGGSGVSDVLLIGAIAILPILGAIVLGGFGDTRRWFRRFANRHY